ncbi:helix-turn-helix domain-containing protein [Pedobacter africanus]|uniref:Helix-turn-helix domain-containing protein n=1 Tax=Pedobacter africanus TaxID=151894 RepID=A0A1W2AVV0_9SPHI|nr:helix-turn-helix transcriptional regulator [Pedobacter africanus]SMC64744.1 Helix-turn-helix domain-containing protein [Pedobacter africanus]
MKNKLTYSSITLGDYIRKIRLEKGYSQYYMADALDISQNSYCLLENGQTKASLDRIIQVALIFKLSPLGFLEGYFNQIDR